MRALVLIAMVCSGCAVQAVTCPNGRIDGLETDLDCGGSVCPPCGDGLICLDDTDCASGICALNHCVAASCHDGVQNGGETGVDCGGSCAACAVSGTCTDGTKSLGETDVDCGGANCPPCADGKSCARNIDCANQVCSDGTCGTPCFGTQARCGGACVDITGDPLNCGGCGHACTAGQACASGSCRDICLGGSRFCAASCVDVATNPQHCGGCNQPCAFPQLCVGGVCGVPCPLGHMLCGGACVDPGSDAANCGGCNQPCTPGTGCVNGICRPGCDAPLELCDNNTVCADTANDPLHCGGCMGQCPPPQNAPRTCVGGQCVLGQCNPGFGDCNANPADGCEADLGLPTSCGSCGRLCQAGDFCSLGRCCQSLPPGTYTATCQQCEACEGLLTCLCKDAAQNLQPTSIPLGPCGGGYTNCNGVLMCNGC
jgi:hypothetical protein